MRGAWTCVFAALVVANAVWLRGSVTPARQAAAGPVDLAPCLAASEGEAERALWGSGDLAFGELRIELSRADRALPRRARPGRSYPVEAEGVAWRGGEAVGTAHVRGRWELVGFEPVATPTASYDDALHVTAARAVEVREPGGPPLREESDVELWCVEGEGVVALRRAARLYVGGVLRDEVGELEAGLRTVAARFD